MGRKKNPLVCCVMCGRDTTARGAVCARCLGGSAAAGCSDEERGRRGRGVTGAKAPNGVVRERPGAAGRYHGETARDDL